MGKDQLVLIAEDIKSQCGNGKVHKLYNDATELQKKGIDRASFDYLRKVGKSKNPYILPAKPRSLDRLGPRIRYLKSREARREILYSINLVDKQSQAEKSEQRVRFMVEQMETLVTDQLGDIDEEILALNETIQDINEQLSMSQNEVEVMTQRRQNGENIPEAQMMNAQQAAKYVQMQSERLKIRINSRVQSLNTKKILSNDVLEDIRQKASTSLKNLKEEKVQTLLETMIFNMNLEEQKKYAFANSLVCGIGAEYYYVDYDPNNSNPIVEAIHPRDVYYPETSNTWVQDGDWVAFKKRMSTEQIIRKFNPKTDVKELLLSREGFYSQQMRTNVNGGARFEESSPGSNVFHEVYFIYWMSEKNVVWSLFDNKYNPSKPHIHLTEDPSSKPKKREKRETTYMTDVYEAVMVDDRFLVMPQVKTDVVRSADNYSIPKLPVVGLVFDEDTRKPYSLVMETKDAVELGIVLNFKMELMIALAGVKGFIMDDSQRPHDMGRDEWNYLRRMGTAYIESVKKGGRPATFNQFQTYDDTLSQSISVLLDIDESLEKHFDVATGVTRQSLAQIETYDLKGTTAMAQQQTMMITEIFYETHERVYCKALEHMVNIKAKFCNDDTIDESFVHPEYGFKTVSFMKGALSERDISIIVQDSGRDERLVQTLQGVAMNYFKEGSIPFTALSAILSSNSFKKIENKISYFMKDFQDKMLNARQNEENQKFENEKQKIQLQGQLNKLIKEMDVSIQNARNEIESRRVNSEDAYRTWEMKFKENEMTSKNALQKYGIDSERAVETSYLGEQKRQSTVDETLRAMEIKLNEMSNLFAEVNHREIETKKLSVIKSKEKIKD